MLSERILTTVVHTMAKRQLSLRPTQETMMPPARSKQPSMLYIHIPFCERLCPYCSFNRYPFRQSTAEPYFKHLRKEMRMVKDLGYNCESIYIGGGTPTVMIDELCETLDLARDLFRIKEVSCETNPNHLVEPYLKKMHGRIQRLSVGVQSFNNTLLKQMDRYEKYGSGEEILERIGEALPYFNSVNVDMIFNFPTQTEDILFADLEKITLSNARQVTFSPLYASAATTRKMAQTLGKLNYDRERTYYHIVDEVLAGGEDALFDRCTLWTFNRRNPQSNDDQPLMVDEYAVAYEEYPGIGSGAISHLSGSLYVNNFSLKDYNAAIDAGHMSLMGRTQLSKRDLMRYRFLLQLYHLRFDKLQFKRDFGTTVERALPAELAFMRANKAFATDTPEEITLSPEGRYLTLVMYREFLSGMNNLRDQARNALTGIEHQLLFGDGTPE